MWAYEYEAGKFIAGEILGDTLYMYAPTGRGEKWVMNSEGVVLEYSSEPFHKSDEIIAGINAHFGTSFYQEDDIDKDFTIGETMPSWNAYEKISKLVYIKRQGPNIAGYIKDDAGYIYTKNNMCYIFNLETGEVQSNSGPTLNDTFKPSIIGWASAAGLNISQVVPKEEIFEIGQVMQNWDDYVTI